MLLADVETDTGDFFAIVDDNSDPTNTVLVQGRLQQDRSRTNWNTHADLGVRFNIKGGLSLEMSYFIDGYLDSVLTAAEIQVPQTVGQAGQGTSAIYSSQDLVVDGWRASVAFQF